MTGILYRLPQKERSLHCYLLQLEVIMVLPAQQAAQPAAVYLLEHHFHAGHVLL